MYSIYAGDTCIYNDSYVLDELTLIDPVLTMEENASGSLEMTLPPGNVGYSWIQRMTTEITVKKDGSEIWSGRVLSESTDFWNRRKLYCEGELAYLNDSIQPPNEYHDVTVRGFLERLIYIHNKRVEDDDYIDKTFVVGMVTVTDSNDSLYRYTNYEKTIECINDKLIGRLGGHLRVRKVNGVRYLDYLSDYPNTNKQVINFGKNLLDFTKSYDLSELATVIVPLGKTLADNSDKKTDSSQSQDSSHEVLQKYLTVKDVNHGSIYVISNQAVENFGWIEKVVRWDDVEIASNLMRKAEKYLKDSQFEEMQLEVKAIDLHYLNINYESIKLLDEIRVVSSPHGLDRLFPVTKLSIPLDSPENATFEIGTKVKQTLTEVHNSTNSEILNRIENIPTPSSILEEARNNASQLIQNATNGYVTILTEDDKTQEILITNIPDYKEAAKVWRWNINGLGYSSTGYNGEYALAMTMDGAIVADRITAGTMYADRIKGGTLTLGGTDDSNGTMMVKDSSGRIMCHINNEGLVTSSSSGYWIKLSDGKIIGGKDSKEYGRLDATASIYNHTTGRTDNGFLITTDTLCLRAGDIATTNEGENATLMIGANGGLTVITDIVDNGNGSLSWTWTTFYFKNGLLISAL